MKDERLLPVGTRVYSILESDWGVVQEHKTGEYPIFVKFEGGKEVYYTKEGKVSLGFENPNLSLTEYNFEKGGFTPISEYWTKPKVSDWGYFWDNKDDIVEFGQIYSIMEFYHTKTSAYRNFSHDIPDHIKKQMQQ